MMAKLHSVPLHRNANFERPPELTETDFTGDPEFEGADKSILAMETISDSSAEERVSIFIVFVFILELLVLVFVCVLEYFLRWVSQNCPNVVLTGNFKKLKYHKQLL